MSSVFKIQLALYVHLNLGVRVTLKHKSKHEKLFVFSKIMWMSEVIHSDKTPHDKVHLKNGFFLVSINTIIKYLISL